MQIRDTSDLEISAFTLKTATGSSTFRVRHPMDVRLHHGQIERHVDSPTWRLGDIEQGRLVQGYVRVLIVSFVVGTHKASRGGPDILVTNTRHQAHSQGVTPFQGTQSHIRGGRTIGGATVCVGLTQNSEFMQR